jgi:hypothetical protein
VLDRMTGPQPEVEEVLATGVVGGYDREIEADPGRGGAVPGDD